MKQTTKNAGTGAALGMCFGVAIGSAIESIGIPIGLCLGMSIGLVIGAKKDEIVNKQVISSSTMETELFKVGDIVFIDEDGDIEQAFDEDEIS